MSLVDDRGVEKSSLTLIGIATKKVWEKYRKLKTSTSDGECGFFGATIDVGVMVFGRAVGQVVSKTSITSSYNN